MQGLYESSVAYGMRKALRSEQLKAELNKRTKEVEMTKMDATRRLEELDQFCEQQRANFKESQEMLDQKNSDELQTMKKFNSALKCELEEYLGSKDRSTKR